MPLVLAKESGLPGPTVADAMPPWVDALAEKYGAIMIGLVLGTGAKYGLAMAEGRRLPARVFAIDALLIGMVALLASNVCNRVGLSGDAAAMVAALFAVSSDRVLRLVRERFLQRIDAELQHDIDHVKGEIRQTAQIELSGERIVRDFIDGKGE